MTLQNKKKISKTDKLSFVNVTKERGRGNKGIQVYKVKDEKSHIIIDSFSCNSVDYYYIIWKTILKIGIVEINRYILRYIRYSKI